MHTGILKNPKKTLEVIKKLKTAKIGKNKKWDLIAKKIKNEQPLSDMDLQYYTIFTRIYKNPDTSSPRSKIYHTKLSDDDQKPPCHECKKDSLYYCNMNDQYFCQIHVVGHDKNEI